MSRLTLAEFTDKISEIMPLIMREFLKEQSSHFYKLKLTMPQVAIMGLLDKQGEAKMSDLANLTKVTTAAMTGIVDRLVRDGYAKREHDAKDRRMVMVRLSRKGSGLMKTIAEERKKVTMKVFGMISEGEREEYLKILTHIKDHILEGQPSRH